MNRSVDRPSETFALWLLLSLCATSIAATLLALFGWFNPFSVAVAALFAGLGSAILVESGRSRSGGEIRPKAERRPGWMSLETLVAFGVLVALAAWFYPPAEFVLGGLDPGVYFNAGVALARAGSFWMPEPLLAQAGPAARSVFVTQSVGLHSVLHPGFYWDGGMGGTTPQFPYLLTVWTGIGALVSGVQGALVVPVAIGIASVAACFLLARRLLGAWGGVAAAALLGFHSLELWHARLALAEELAQGLLLAGLWCGVRWLETGRRIHGMVAGLALGTLCLVKTEAALVGLMAVAALLSPPAAASRSRLPVVAGWAAGAGTAAVVYATVAQPLLLDQAPSTWPLLALALAMTAAVVAAGRLVRRNPATDSGNEPRRRLPVARALWLAALLLPVAAAVVMAEAASGYPSRFAGALVGGLYLSPLDAALIIVAAWTMIGYRRDWRHRWVVAVLAVASVLYLGIYFRYIPSADRIPLYLWATRRLVPAVLPALALLEAGGLVWLTRLIQVRQPAVVLATLALLVAARWPGGSVVAAQREYQGAVAAVGRLAGLTEPNAVLLFEPSDTAIRLATPLRFLKDRSAYVAWNPNRAGVDGLIETAAEAGRPVYYLGSEPGALSGILTTYDSSFVARWSADLPELERTSAHPPAAWNNFHAVLDIYRISNRAAAKVPTASAVRSTR